MAESQVGKGAGLFEEGGSRPPIRVAYADPPYLGTPGSRVSAASLYPEHPEAWRFDDPTEHGDLMFMMHGQYDAWALSLHEPSLRVLLPLAPKGVRVAAWVKPFASFKPGIDPAYTWEPVIYRTARKWGREQPTCRDHISTPIALQKGLTGAKPDAFCFWLFELLGATRDDEFHDLFPGSGQVTRAWEKWCGQTVRTAQGTLALALPPTATRPQQTPAQRVPYQRGHDDE